MGMRRIDGLGPLRPCTRPRCRTPRASVGRPRRRARCSPAHGKRHARPLAPRRVGQRKAPGLALRVWSGGRPRRRSPGPRHVLPVPEGRELTRARRWSGSGGAPALARVVVSDGPGTSTWKAMLPRRRVATAVVAVGEPISRRRPRPTPTATVRGEPRSKFRAVVLLVALEDDLRLTGNGRAWQEGGDGGDMRMVPPLVVGRAAGEMRSADGRLERRRDPQSSGSTGCTSAWP